MRGLHVDEFINCEELSDLLSEFDDRLSYQTIWTDAVTLKTRLIYNYVTAY